METLLLIAALVVSLLISLLALANKEAVTINFLIGQSRISLIILILGSASGGAILVGLFSLLRGARNALRFRELRRRLAELQQRLTSLEQENRLLNEKLQPDFPPGGKEERPEQLSGGDM